MNSYNGWIVYNGNMRDEKFYGLARHLNDIAKSRGVNTALIKNNELLVAIEKGRSVIKGKYEGELPDFVIFWDKDIRLGRQLEKLGLRLYNTPASIEICDDKTLTHQILADNCVPMPKTIIAPKVFIEAIDFTTYDYVIEELGFPMIIKEAFGSFGAQVYKVNNREELFHKVKELGAKPYLFQEFIASSCGRDVRLNVVGDKVVAAMLRTSETDFRANISNGGRMHRYEPTREQVDLAVKCSKIIGTDFAGVDILFGEKDEPILCEVNSNAHMKNIYDCTGVDVGEYIVDYIIEDLRDKK